MSAKPCARLPELGLHFPCLIQFICMNAIISCSNTENTIYSKMVLYMDHMKIYIPLVAISNVCICHRQRLDVYSARSPANQSQFHGWIDGIPDFMTAHPASSSGSDSTKPPDNSDNIPRLHTLILSCNIYEHVAMARETNEPIGISFIHTSTSHCHLGRHHGPCMGFTAASLGSNRHFGQKYREFTDRNLLLRSDHQYLEWAEKYSQ